MKKLLLILLLCSGCYGTYYTTDVKRRVYYPKPTYYKPYVYKPITTVVIKPNKIHVNNLDGTECLTQVCLNDQLIKEKHAVAYFGGKR